MGMGAITWTCLLLSVHQGPPEEVYIPDRAFEIPIRIVAGKQADIHQLFLYYSGDEGNTWQIWRKVPPTEKSFVFKAPRDGRYLFIVGQEDQQGNPTPADPLRVRPHQRVVVDTVAPRIQVTTAERQTNGEVLLRWSITEENPDPQSLRLDYRTTALRPDQWTPLPVDPQSTTNEMKFPAPSNAGELRVRVRIKDRAGNEAVKEEMVRTAGSAVPAAPAPAPTIGLIPINRTDSSPPGLLTSRQTAPLTPGRARPEEAPLPLSPPEPMSSPSPLPAGPAPVAASTGVPSPPAPFTPETAKGALPPLQIVKTRQVNIEFEVAKVGPSGLGGADVYFTLNEGATWERWPGEVPVNLPSVAESHGSTPIRGSVTVQLAREATTYGFIVAVKSKAGRAKPAPQPGEPPHIRIELDATEPKAELYEPRPHPQQPDTLILSWHAVDRNLPSQPITLEWAEHREGPWTCIGSEHLPNTMAEGLPPIAKVTGACTWRLPERMPSRVYLKLTVQDKAGNRAVAATPTPVLIDLSVPETNILGVVPGPR